MTSVTIRNVWSSNLPCLCVCLVIILFYIFGILSYEKFSSSKWRYRVFFMSEDYNSNILTRFYCHSLCILNVIQDSDPVLTPSKYIFCGKHSTCEFYEIYRINQTAYSIYSARRRKLNN